MRITQGRARAMGLQITDGARRHMCSLQGIRHQARLGHRVGHGVAIGLAASIDHAALDDAVDLIVVGNGLVQGLEQNRTHTLASDKTIRARAEGPARIA